MEYIIAFGSANLAIKAEQCLLEQRLHVTVLPLPPQIRAGCGICLRVQPDEIGPAMKYLAAANIGDVKLYSKSKDSKNQSIYNETEAHGFMELGSLLDNCTSGGCGAKIGPGTLAELLAGLPTREDANLLVGYDTSDDAAVYKISDTQSIVTTADFFPPMVADPKTFGRIAAANALSDVYSMGGTPLTAINLVCFPQSMDHAILREILTGGAEKVIEASAALCGGHSIYDKEPKYGLAVTGIVDNDKIYRNNTPKVSDKLILTKPLGTGLIMAALRVGAASDDAVLKATRSMERLNKYAAEKAQNFAVSACTDITGFGLLAHALEMASDTVSIALYPAEIPYISQAYDYAEEYMMTAAGQRNRNHLDSKADVSMLPFPIQELLFDPQTSGGLLLSVSSEQSADLLAAIQGGDPDAKIIGEIIPRQDAVILFE